MAYADFKNGHYWYSGAEGVVTGFLANADLVVPGTGYVQAAHDTNTDIVGAPLAAYVAMNWTIVYDVTPDASVFFIVAKNGDDSHEVDNNVQGVGPYHLELYGYNDAGGFDDRDVVSTAEITPGAPNKAAATWTSAKSALSVNGSAADVTTKDLMVIVDDATIGYYGDPAEGFTLRSLAIYAPQPNTDLPTLSGA